MQAKYSLSWKCQLNIMRKGSKQRNNAQNLDVRRQAIGHGAVLVVSETLGKSLNFLLLFYEMSILAGKNMMI